ncbi:hypothetical protein tb265_14460 [Gemmatimonadetes bacterium T265]|nr:hypothetical protein tb265_14460 [Gemmatimonadetes bacterium T265]
MATLYALDANCYIHALRDAEERRRLNAFVARVDTRLRLHAVVHLELRAGARTAAQRAALDALVGTYAAREHVVTPDAAAFAEAGRVLADLAVKEHFAVADAPPSFRYAALLAASCREAGLTLVTRNHADFVRVGRHLRGFRVAAPWPSG